MPDIHFFAVCFYAFAISAMVVYAFATTGLRNLCLDRPNDRSSHEHPTPRCGGIGLLFGAVSAVAFLDLPATLTTIVWLAAVLFIVSLFDDFLHLPPLVRLGVHAAAALTAALVLGVSWSAWLIVVVVGLMWMSNLYNFMDGSDALAGLMGVIGFAAYAAGAFVAGDVAFAQVCACLSAATLGFLIWNWPPARIFLGDGGAIPLGFLAGALGYYGYAQSHWSIAFPLLVFLPFIADASLTLVHRAIRQRNLLQAHREHLYQRVLTVHGWTKAELAALGAVIMLLSAGCALLFARGTTLAGLVALCVALVAMGIAAVGLERKARS